MGATLNVTSSSFLSQVSRLWYSFWKASVFAPMCSLLDWASQELGPHLTPFSAEPLAWHLAPLTNDRHMHQ